MSHATTWRNVVIATLCAILTFGGTFTCRADSDSDSHTENPRTGAR